MIDWYEYRNDLVSGMIFRLQGGDYVKLDRTVPGDATQWYVQSWYHGYPNVKGYERGHWSCDDNIIEPSDLVELMPRDWESD